MVPSRLTQALPFQRISFSKSESKITRPAPTTVGRLSVSYEGNPTATSVVLTATAVNEATC